LEDATIYGLTVMDDVRNYSTAGKEVKIWADPDEMIWYYKPPMGVTIGSWWHWMVLLMLDWMSGRDLLITASPKSRSQPHHHYTMTACTFSLMKSADNRHLAIKIRRICLQ
jgi:hypothetical protein